MNEESWMHYLSKTPCSNGFTLEIKNRVRNYLINGADIQLEPGVDPRQLKFRSCPNLPTAYGLEQEVKLLEDFQKEISLGRRAGPFREIPNEHLQCSPLGTVPKKHSTKLRTILHLSYPRDGSDSSINSQIVDIDCMLMRFNDAVKEITRKGKGCLLAKFDIKDAFRLIRVMPEQQVMLGMKFMEWYFVELTLPFGLKSAPALFEMFSTAIEKFILNEGVESLFHYLDDFLLICLRGSQSAIEYETVLRIFKELHIELAKEKLSPPTTRLEFLGLILDSDSMMIELPEDKLIRYRDMIHSFRLVDAFTLKDLEQLVGILVYSSMVIQHGKSFYYHLIQIMKEARICWKEGSSSTQKLRLTAGASRELEWWAKFIVEWNGKCMISPSISDFETAATHHLYVDACKTGMGAWFDNCEYISHVWDAVELGRAKRVKMLSMPYLELLALTHSVGVWRDKLRGRALVIDSDCLPVVMAFQKGYSTDGNIMILLRQLAYFTATHNIFIHVQHIAGINNVVADCLSRLTDCANDTLIVFSTFFDLKEVKATMLRGITPKRREVKSFHAMNWNKLGRTSKLKQSQ